MLQIITKESLLCPVTIQLSPALCGPYRLLSFQHCVHFNYPVKLHPFPVQPSTEKSLKRTSVQIPGALSVHSFFFYVLCPTTSSHLSLPGLSSVPLKLSETTELRVNFSFLTCGLKILSSQKLRPSSFVGLNLLSSHF